MEHGILNGLRIKVVGDIGRKGRKRREPVDEVDLALGSRALSAYMRQHLLKFYYELVICLLGSVHPLNCPHKVLNLTNILL